MLQLLQHPTNLQREDGAEGVEVGVGADKVDG